MYDIENYYNAKSVEEAAALLREQDRKSVV